MSKGVNNLPVTIDSVEFVRKNDEHAGAHLEVLVKTANAEGEIQHFRESLYDVYCGSKPYPVQHYNDEREQMSKAMIRLGERLKLHYDNDVFTPDPEPVSKE